VNNNLFQQFYTIRFGHGRIWQITKICRPNIGKLEIK